MRPARGYITRPCLEMSEQTAQSKVRKKPRLDVLCMPGLLGSREAEVEWFFKSRPAWAAQLHCFKGK